MLKILSVHVRMVPSNMFKGQTYDRTLEKSAVGDMTKLSPFDDHDIRC